MVPHARTQGRAWTGQGVRACGKTKAPMATVAEPLARVQDPPRPGVSPLVEFLLVGGATPVLFAFGWVLRRVVGLDAADLAFGFTFFYAAHLLNDPHFAVTYVLFYGKARERAFGRVLPPM